jgi:transcriptional regulator
MNLTRRSQALRLRRKGDSPEQIAETLNMPRQEVSLLLKVHEIVLNNL